MDALILALDIGTTGTKAAVVDMNGVTQRLQYRPYKTRLVGGGQAEQDPEDWWEAASASIRNLAIGQREIQQNITAIAITGQMQNLILTRDSDAVRSAILYSDTRAGEEAEQVNQIIGSDKLRRITGNDQDASSLLAKLLWLKKHTPKVLTDTRVILTGAHDYITLKLCGEAVCDVVTASTTGLLNLSERTWAKDLLSALDLPPLAFGKLTPGGQVVGHLGTRAAGLLGLPKGLPICHGPGDAGATTLGAGAGEPGSVYAYLGTSGWVGFTSEQPGDPDQGVWTLAHPKPNYVLPVAPILSAGACLEWLREQFKEGHTYGDFTRLAEQAAPSELLFLPYLAGERAPFRDANARGAFFGLTRRTTTHDLYRAVLEGVVYAYRHLLDSLGVGKPASMVITGGGTKSPYWMQLFANILNVPIVVPYDSQYVGVKGAALAAWVAQGKYTSYTPPEYFHYETHYEPKQDLREAYEAYYAVYRNLYKTLQDTFAGMREAAKKR